MQYAFKVTANRNIGGSKGIAKGMTVQISKEGAAPNINDILTTGSILFLYQMVTDGHSFPLMQIPY